MGEKQSLIMRIYWETQESWLFKVAEALTLNTIFSQRQTIFGLGSQWWGSYQEKHNMQIDILVFYFNEFFRDWLIFLFLIQRETPLQIDSFINVNIFYKMVTPTPSFQISGICYYLKASLNILGVKETCFGVTHSAPLHNTTMYIV